MVARQNDLNGTAMPTIRCARCHRRLTLPKSICQGYGEICWGRIQAWNRKEEAEADDELAVRRLREEISEQVNGNDIRERESPRQKMAATK